MTVPQYGTLGLIILSAVVGFFGTVLAKWLATPRSIEVSNNGKSTAAPLPHDQKGLDRCMSSISELTSHVDTQVSEHAIHVSRITDSMATPNAESAFIVEAAKMLITANEKLRSDLEETQKEIDVQREQMDSCRNESRTDSLTALPNRRAFDNALIRQLAQFRRDASPFCLVMIDIDHFKRVNDQYGHMVGDQVLKSVARRLASSVREVDFVARYGGEEFIAILPNTRIHEAFHVTNRIRSECCGAPHSVSDFQLTISVSSGVKEVEPGEAGRDLFQKVDKALYAAKKGGRNCSYFHNGSECLPQDISSIAAKSDPELPTNITTDAAAELNLTHS